MEEFLENGHVLCDPSSKEGKSCAWICNPGYSLVGPDHAKCTCDSALGCGWNGDVQFEPPICIKECWFMGVLDLKSQTKINQWEGPKIPMRRKTMSPWSLYC